MLDFSKTFGSVNHEKLIYRLHGDGISAKTLTWIKASHRLFSLRGIALRRPSGLRPWTNPLLGLYKWSDRQGKITGETFRDDILKIEMVQRRAVLWVLGDYSPCSSVTNMLGKLGWRTLAQRRADSRMVLFYKIVYGYVAVPLPTYVIPWQGNRLTRTLRTSHPLAYRQLYARTDYFEYMFSLYPLAVVQWNNLPVPVATLTSKKLSVRCATSNHKFTTTVFILTFSFITV